MKLFPGSFFRRKPNPRRSELRHRSLRMESLENRQLLTVVTLTPVKDNSIFNGFQSNSAGQGGLYVGLNNPSNSPTNVKRSLLDFDVAAAVPAGATINSVTLTMYVYRNNNGATTTAELHKLLADWGEGTSAAGTAGGGAGQGQGAPATTNDATWLKSFYNTVSWATAGGDFSPTISGSTVLTGPGGTGSKTWASTAQMVADVQSWVDNPSTAYGWLIKAGETTNTSHAFYSRERATAAQRPTLTIDYTGGTAVPTLAIAATDANKPEGNSGSTPFTFTVTRTGDTSGTSTVNYAVTGSGANAANATDFAGGVLPSGSVTFAADETSKVVTVDVNGDTAFEPDEGFTVTLSGATGGTITTATAAGTIANDDAVVLPTLAIAAADASKAEGNSAFTRLTFTVTRSGDTTKTSTVKYAVAGSGANAANAADFVGKGLPKGSVTFAAGATTRTITIKVMGNKTIEPDETFVVNLSNATGATIAGAQAEGTIVNDDGAVSLLPDGSLSIVGSDRPDVISVGADATGRILVRFNGQRFGPYNVAGGIVGNGGKGNDKILVGSSVRLAAVLDGGDGNDILQGGQGNDTLRGGAGNDVLRGGAGDDWLYGGAGNDHLFGGAGNDGILGGEGIDLLNAGAGQNLLIGGLGADTLKGNTGEDILIGGTTAHDNNDPALAAIMGEWSSALSFTERADRLEAGITDPTLGLLQLSKGLTVLDDAARDLLFGAAGDDWFFDFSPLDRLQDRKSNDRRASAPAAL